MQISRIFMLSKIMNELPYFLNAEATWRYRAAGNVWQGVKVNLDTIRVIFNKAKGMCHLFREAFFLAYAYLLISIELNTIVVFFYAFHHGFGGIVLVKPKDEVFFKEAFFKSI